MKVKHNQSGIIYTVTQSKEIPELYKVSWNCSYTEIPQQTDYTYNTQKQVDKYIGEGTWIVIPENKYTTGDKVISVKDIPNRVKGAVGYIIEGDKEEYDYIVEFSPEDTDLFKEDGLELFTEEKKANKFPVGSRVIANKENTQLKNEKKDSGWTDQYYAFLKGVPCTVMSITNNGFELQPDGCDETFFTDDYKDKLVTYVENQEEYTGGSSSYYKVEVLNPTTQDSTYLAECNDIIESLNMTFAEGNLFKAVWRIAADRQGKKKKGNNSVYDAEKAVFFAERLLIQEKEKDK